MASIPTLDTPIASATSIEQQAVASVTAAFARLKTPIDYTTQVAAINAIITALTNLDTLAKAQ